MLDAVQRLDNENIVIVTYSAPFEPGTDIAQAQEQIAALLPDVEGTLYRIDDLSQSGMDWNSFVEGIFVATRDVPGSMTDARVQGVLVGENDLVKMASESMKQQQYGATDTPMFTSLDAALTFVRSIT